MCIIPPHALASERTASGGPNRMIKRFDLKCPPFGRKPTDPIIATSIQPNRVEEIEERSDRLYLPLMHGLI
jgi:hypothetical protein